jgi:hypothetical protein
MAHDVFISYAGDDKSGDEKKAFMVCDYLESRGIKCWIYKRDEPHGAKFEEEISKAIDDCKVLVLIYTSNSNTSKYVELEVTLAWKKGKAIIPFWLENIPYNDILNFYLNSHNWLDATIPPMDLHMSKLYNDVDQFLKGNGDRKYRPRRHYSKIIIAIAILLIIAAGALLMYSSMGHSDVPNVQWYKIYGGLLDDSVYSIAQTKDSGYMLAGYTESYGNGSSDIYLIKTDPFGNKEWTKTIGNIKGEIAKSIQPSSDGGFVIAGATESKGNGSYDAYLAKIDDSGNILWDRTFGASSMDSAFDAKQTRDGGYITVGELGLSEDRGIGLSDVYLVKTDANGNMQWDNVLGDDGMDIGLSVIQSKDGSYVVTGVTGSGNLTQDSDVYLIKTDDRGQYIWKNKIGGAGADYGNSVIQSNDGSFVIGGYTESSGNGGKDMYLIKTDQNGNVLWSKTFGGKYDDVCYAVTQTSDGGFAMVGNTETEPGVEQGYLVKTDADGNMQWSKNFGYSKKDTGHSILLSSDGGYIIGGTTSSRDGSTIDTLLVKIST